MSADSFVIGVDFGTDSVRSLLLDTATGNELTSSVFYYPRWKQGKYCDPSLNQFRQHPLDHIEGLEYTIRDCISKAGPHVASCVKGIAVDTTGSTPVAVDRTGKPLALLPAFQDNPNAMFVLWKDHTAIKEAEEINRHAATYPVNYLQFVGGIYSSEWYWAKLLHILKADAAIRSHLYSWVEHCDWIPFLLTGGVESEQIKRGICSAGHKALWADEFGGLPPDDFFAALHPHLKGITQQLFTKTYTADQPAGKISPEWAQRLGLPENVVIGIGAFDCHMGAVGGQIEPYYLSKVIGTSTCDILVAPLEEVKNKLIKGICGQVPGSVIPGMMGFEAGQSAFGDSYAWFKQILSWPIQQIISNTKLLDSETIAALIEETEDKILPLLNQKAAELPFEDPHELALDWLNGRRTPDANQVLKAAFTGLNLGTDAVKMYRALAEATCFGAKAIIERFVSEGIPVKGLIGLGGVARKSPYIMQMMADVTGMSIKIHKSEQTCALGAGMFAATAAGVYEKVEDAMIAMGQGFDAVFYPDAKKTLLYEKRYHHYQNLGNFIENKTREML